MELYRGDQNCGFTPTDADEHIGEKLWPILKRHNHDRHRK